ncbi:MAG TPA: NADPH:quinone oxidoreductase family protein [Acidimicrobiales bacterium]|jgi:NADPH:quinone reductase-like Zn-dependent oxidoreductase|nr:NADPH:quinone oxidoreductase family protein [Acidimicrobiales bacterium]
MRAAICHEYGDPEVVRIEDRPDDPVGPGQIRVGIAAASVNFPDVLIVANRYQMSVPVPFIPGSEFAGQVLEVGPGTDTHKVGDRVFGTTMVGAFAETIVVAAAAVSPIPSGVTARSAAAFGIGHRTAYLALRAVGDLQPGDEVVVLGAGGGVGLAAVQIGSALGARVTAVASSAEKLGAATRAGAVNVVNHRDGDLRARLKEVLPGGSHLVIDPVGGHLSEPALRSLGWGGRFVTVGFAAGDIPRIPLNLVLLKGIHILGFEFRGFAVHHAEEMRRGEAELMELFGQGRIDPHIGAAFPLEQAAAALRYVADGRAVGKVVVDVAP